MVAPRMNLPTFVDRWLNSGSSERANKDSFLKEPCLVLDLPQPDPKRGDPEKDRYVFERDVRVQAPDGKVTTKFMDLYKEGCFVLEAKQSAQNAAARLGARVSTEAWENAMERAYSQARRYAENVVQPPPFLIVCDIAHCFDVYAGFDGTARYQPFPVPEKKRLPFADLATHAELLRTIWTDPLALDPSRHAKKVSEEVAASLAEVARDLEASGNQPEAVADFLMRCLFTMFAEDVGLLEENLFTNAIETRWIPKPDLFPSAIENLWQAMNTGSIFGMDKLLRFNGGLFQNASALRLNEGQLEKLLAAAKRDWSKVEPAIFGTLLEQALDPKERHKLGAHYTPRAYVERLVRPTVEEPVRDEWDIVRAEVFRFRELGKPEDAKTALRRFHTRLTEIRVLDPACGTGNFLYVTLDILKQIESEVLAELRALGETQQLLDISRVSPAQLFGIEVNPRAKAIAELVLWIGHLQWHYKVHGRLQPPPEPVLQDLKTIDCHDGVLAWDDIELIRDEKGKPKTRWDGVTMKESKVTGEKVPDESATVVVERYIGPRKAVWPKAEFIVGNPPFIGSKRMRDALGDGYVDSLRLVYSTIPDGTDYVLYWWVKAAELVRSKQVQRFGFITTNSITQSMNRKATESALFSATAEGVIWAIADHPWVDSSNGAAVRIAMTVGGQKGGPIRLVRVMSESPGPLGQVDVALSVEVVPEIHSNLTGGAAVVSAKALKSNAGMCSVALVRFGEGFVVDEARAKQLEQAVVHPLLTGRDVNQSPSAKFVIDLYPMTEQEACSCAPKAFQHVLEYVKPGRDQIRDPGSRARWWRFGRDKPELRAAIAGIRRFIATSEVSKHRVFSFVNSNVRPDHSLIVVASDDAFVLGVLGSRVHSLWAMAAGSRMGVANDLRYNRSVCFDPFPFPICTPAQQAHIRDLGEQLDSHRKRQQSAHPELTITGTYNVLEKLRRGTSLTEKDKITHQQGLVSVLKKNHDDLDAAVFDAYGWPRDLTDEQILERLVALNAERAEEERKGHVRWLRPDFQNPTGVKNPTNLTIAGTDAADDEETAAPEAAAAAWPKRPGERIAAIRDLVVASKRLWQTGEVAAAFKGAKKKDVADLLDSLAGIGVLVAYGETEKDLRWGQPTRGAA